MPACAHSPARQGIGPSSAQSTLNARHPVSIAFQLAAVPGRKTMTGDSQERPRREIAQDGSRRRQLVDRLDRSAGHDLAAERFQMRRERVGQPLRTAARRHPACDMGHHAKHEPERGARPPIERQHGVGADAGEQRASPIVGEYLPRQALGRTERLKPEADDRSRVSRQARRRQDGTLEPRPGLHQCSDQRSIGIPITIQTARRAFDRSIDETAAAVVERMREHGRRFDPLQSMGRERQASE